MRWVTLEEELADGVLTFTLPEFENNPSCTGILINIAWGENTAWYAAAFQTGPEDPEGAAVDSPSSPAAGTATEACAETLPEPVGFFHRPAADFMVYW